MFSSEIYARPTQKDVFVHFFPLFCEVSKHIMCCTIFEAVIGGRT